MKKVGSEGIQPKNKDERNRTMGETIVLYSSVYGSTQAYAEQIAETLDCRAVPIDAFKKSEFVNYRTVIYGGGVQAGVIRGFEKFAKWIKSDLKLLEMVSNGTITAEEARKAGTSRKKIIVFAVGITVESEEARQQLIEINFDKKYLKNLKCYFLPGAYDPSTLKGADKLLMKIARKMIAGKSERDRLPDDAVLEERLEHGCDLVDMERIKPIVDEALANENL